MDAEAEGWKRNLKDIRESPISCRSYEFPPHSHGEERKEPCSGDGNQAQEA